MTAKKTKKVTKKIAQEREYIIPLRREISKVARHKKTPKAVKAIKQFLAKHMRVPEKDISKIKLDIYLNQEIWFRGIKNPPTKIKVKAKRDGEVIRVSLVDIPDRIKFQLAREEKKKKSAEDIKKAKKTEEKPIEKKSEEKTEEEKKEEQEKKQAGSELEKKVADTQAKEAKHTQAAPKQPKVQPQRKALQK
ncbi:hypothetical protein CMI46_02585 [Candidatus Pacearchaeota archaeon]|nr:hypothetical protein [Candidatus Pacearchaeota archaeon]|tara:strand:- start:7510 stop:8085 length:576 start_codon:yes stop_codon:yes gene_type:complete